MTTKHTPSPWHAVEYSGYFRFQDGPYYEDNDITDVESVGRELAESNAKLIAAAPDLLEALTNLVERYMPTNNDIELIKARAAIKKATE